jgi:hypothetical protein
MKNRAWLVSMPVVGAFALAAATLASPAQAQQIRSANGTLYWNKDPGPIDPGPYWTSGQYKYDPNGYMERVARDPDQFHEMTVYADHAGKENCVFRRRVVVTTWDFNHPYLRVCRRPQKD